MDKQAITEAVLEKLNKPTTAKELKKALRSWWYPDYVNNRTNARLTKRGVKAISKVMRSYEFEWQFTQTGKNIKRLQALKTPFFVNGDTVTIFSEQLATMIKMYPNFERYMELINDRSH